MRGLFEPTERGVSVRVNHRGEAVTLTEQYAVVLENVLGAMVRLASNGKQIVCEALVEESTSWHRWHFHIERTALQTHPTCSMAANVESLEQLISNLRVALNGKW